MSVGSIDWYRWRGMQVVTLQSRLISLRSGAGGTGETSGRREGVVDGARAGQGRSGVGAADVAGVLAGGRPGDPGGVIGRAAASGGSRVGGGRCRSRICYSPAAPQGRSRWRGGARSHRPLPGRRSPTSKRGVRTRGYPQTRFDAGAATKTVATHTQGVLACRPFCD